MADLSAKIEAILFFRGEPTSRKRLAELLETDEAAISAGLSALKEELSGRGITLMEKDGEAMLATSPKESSLVERIVKEDIHKDLGRAGLETLSIILYLGPVPRSRIDHIRGVSSTFIVRNLLIRGLIERIENEKDKRAFLYRPTFELLSYLGVSSAEDLPEYAAVREELAAREAAAKAAEAGPEESDAS